MGGTATIDAVSPRVWISLAKVAARAAGGDGAVVVFASGDLESGEFRAYGQYGDAPAEGDALMARAARLAIEASSAIVVREPAEDRTALATSIKTGAGEALGAVVVLSSHGRDFDGEPTLALGEVVELTSLGLSDHLRLADAFEDLDHERKSEQVLLQRGTEALRDAEDRLSALVHASPLAIYSVDPEGLVTSWNPAAERIFGWSASEVMGRFLPIVPEDKEAEFKEMRERSLRGERIAERQLVRMHKSGRQLELSVSTAALHDANGKPVAIMGITADVTERRRVEEQLRQSQKLEALGRLAGGVAHDFNNLLAVVQSYAGLLQKSLPQGDTRLEHVEQIRAAGERAARLTRQLLAFGRKQVLQPVRLDVNAIIEAMALLLRHLLGERVELEIDLLPGLDPVKADPSQLEQVIMNLCLNARDAMPSGGRMTVRTHTEAEGVLASRAVVLSVSDNGHGMDAATQEQMFDPFFTTKEPGRGTGLGLSTVYGIVQQSGGAIRVESEPGRGSTLRVYLPCLGRSTTAHTLETSAVKPVDAATTRASSDGGASSSQAHPASPTAGSDVLLIEDDPLVRMLAARILREERFSVVEAATAEAALRLMEDETRHIDAVITDYSMPGMNGRALAAEIARARPAVKVLFVSGYGAAFGPLEPGTAFVAKPFTPATLVGTLRLLLAS